MAGYVRPRLTDKQAAVLQLVLDRELAAGYRPGESAMLARVQWAVDDAFVQREKRRERRRARDEALSRRGLLARTFRRRERRPF